MLVLSRKVGEQIQIGDDIRVTVVRIAGGGVRAVIEAVGITGTRGSWEEWLRLRARRSEALAPRVHRRRG